MPGLGRVETDLDQRGAFHIIIVELSLKVNIFGGCFLLFVDIVWLAAGPPGRDRFRRNAKSR